MDTFRRCVSSFPFVYSHHNYGIFFALWTESVLMSHTQFNGFGLGGWTEVSLFSSPSLIDCLHYIIISSYPRRWPNQKNVEQESKGTRCVPCCYLESGGRQENRKKMIKKSA